MAPNAQINLINDGSQVKVSVVFDDYNQALAMQSIINNILQNTPKLLSSEQLPDDGHEDQIDAGKEDEYDYSELPI